MIYDVLHGPGTAGELDGLERLAAVYAPADAAPGPWLEPACGTGRLLRLAASRGRPGVGFDTEPGMVEYASERAARAGLGGSSRFVVGDMRSFVDDGVCAPGSISFAFNTINTFRHLLDDETALAHLGQATRALAPGGVYAVGLSTCLYGCEQPSEDVWTGARGRLRVTQTVQYIPATGRHGGARRERVFSHLTIERPGGVEHRDSTYALRTYDLGQWLTLLDASPMRLIATCDDEGRPSEPAMSGYRLYVLSPR